MKKSIKWTAFNWIIIIAAGIYIIFFDGLWALYDPLCYPLVIFGGYPEFNDIYLSLQALVLGMTAMRLSQESLVKQTAGKAMISVLSVLSLVSAIMVVAACLPDLASFDPNANGAHINHNLIWKGEGTKVSVFDQNIGLLVFGVIAFIMVTMVITGPAISAIGELDNEERSRDGGAM